MVSLSLYMQLKFPHARLLVYDCLVNQDTGCVQAIVKSAHALGLIGSDKLTHLRLPIEKSGCGSLFSARQVLEQCLSERGYDLSNGGRKLADELWKKVELDVDSYKSATSLVHNRQAGEITPVIECSHMAPVVMDILLQHLTPYD